MDSSIIPCTLYIAVSLAAIKATNSALNLLVKNYVKSQSKLN